MSGTTTQTVGGLITLVLKLVGVVAVGQTPSAEDVNDALTILNQMLALWNGNRWLVYGLEDVAFISTGAESYTIGIGENFDIGRPDRLEAAFMRQLQTGGTYAVDYPIAIIPSREDYNRIAVKSLASFGQAVFYDAAYPVGNLYFWPLPQASLYELHVSVKVALQQFSGLTQTIALPPLYQEALMWNLAARLKPLYGMAPDQTITAMATAALETIRTSNAQIPTLRMPADVPGQGSGVGIFNPYSGGFS